MKTPQLAWIVGLLLLAAILLLVRGAVSGQARLTSQTQTRVSVSSIELSVHPVENALTQQVNSTYNMPYARLDRGKYDAGRLETRTFTLVTLENDYLKLTLLPELGGRIYQVIFKPTGNNMFYQNPVLKPSPWGPPEMGWWWAAGGMEWGLPVEEHGYEWGIPWQYTIIETADGVTVELRDSTASDRLRARVAVTLPNDTAFFEVSPTLDNPTAAPIDTKFWLNAMLAPGPANRVSPNLRIIMPTDRVTVHSSGDSRLPGPWTQANWPVHNGVDYSLLGNWRQWYGFFQYPRAGGDFQAIYDEGYNEGVVRTYNSQQVQGAKFFAFGNGSQAISPDLYTDDGSSYVEIHGGVAPTFADTRRLNAGEQFTWTERWYPVAGLGSLTWANDRIALNLQTGGSAATLHVAATRPLANARVLLLRRATNEVLFQADNLAIEPGQPYHSPAVNTGPLSRSELAVAVYNEGALIGAYQYSGGQPVTPTPGAPPQWQGQLMRETPFNSWASVLRVWVRNQIGLPVTLATENGSWRVTNKTGSKAEYGIDALEFAPLAPGVYVLTPEGLGTSFKFELKPGTIAEVVFDQTAAGPTPPTATPTPTATRPPASPSPIATATHSPTPTVTPSPTANLSGWQGQIRRTVPVTGWACVARIWITGKPGLKVTLTALEWNWSGTALTGSKAEYGPDALEFSPLPPGRYVARVPELAASFEFRLEASRITEVVFAPAPPPPTPASSATPTPTFTATATPTAGPQASPTVSPTTTASPTATPSPTASATFTPTATRTPTPASGWTARVASNQPVSSNWFSVIRVSVQNQLNLPVRITLLTPQGPTWSATCRTGSKPEFGPTFCEFAPIVPGTYLLAPQGVDTTATVTVAGGAVAVVLFEKN